MPIIEHPDEVINSGEDIDQKIENFLNDVPEKYIEQMKRPGVWGAALEIGIIADLLNVKIKIFKKVNDELNNYDVDPKKAEAEIYLLLTGEDSGNGHYNVIKLDKTKPPDIIQIPPDGNCLFHACIEACKLSDHKLPQNITDHLTLREAVCEKLTQDKVRKEEVKNALFSPVLNSETINTSEWELTLPTISLTKEAVDLRIAKSYIDNMRNKSITDPGNENSIKPKILKDNIITIINESSLESEQQNPKIIAAIDPKDSCIECYLQPNSSKLLKEQQQLFIAFLQTEDELNQTKNPKEKITIEVSNFSPQDLTTIINQLNSKNPKLELDLKLPEKSQCLYGYNQNYSEDEYKDLSSKITALNDSAKNHHLKL